MGGTYPFLTCLWPLGNRCPFGGLHTVRKFLNNGENNWKLWKKHWKCGFFTEINPVLTAYFVSLFTPYKVWFLVFCKLYHVTLLWNNVTWKQPGAFLYILSLKNVNTGSHFISDPCSYGASFSPVTQRWCHIRLKDDFLWHCWCWSRSCPCSGGCPKDPKIILSSFFSSYPSHIHPQAPCDSTISS